MSNREIEFEGLRLMVYRDREDGALRICVDTHDMDPKDEYPATGVPKLRLTINAYTGQLDQDGGWIDEQPFPVHTVLDHIVAETS